MVTSPWPHFFGPPCMYLLSTGQVMLECSSADDVLLIPHQQQQQQQQRADVMMLVMRCSQRQNASRVEPATTPEPCSPNDRQGMIDSSEFTSQIMCRLEIRLHIAAGCTIGWTKRFDIIHIINRVE